MTFHIQTETVFAACITDSEDNTEGDVEDSDIQYNTVQCLRALLKMFPFKTSFISLQLRHSNN